MVQDFDEGGEIEYAVNFKSPKQVSSRRTEESSKTTIVSSTPKDDAGCCSVQADKELVVKITPLEEREKDLRNQDDEVDNSQSKEECLSSPSVKIEDASQHMQQTNKVPSTTNPEPPKEPMGGAGTSHSHTQKRAEEVPSSGGTMFDRWSYTQAVFIDLRRRTVEEHL